MQISERREQFTATAAAQVLHQILRDAEVSGRLRRQADAVVSGVVRELVSREWMEWDDERLVLTEVGREGLALLRLQVNTGPLNS